MRIRVWFILLWSLILRWHWYHKRVIFKACNEVIILAGLSVSLLKTTTKTMLLRLANYHVPHATIITEEDYIIEQRLICVCVWVECKYTDILGFFYFIYLFFYGGGHNVSLISQVHRIDIDALPYSYNCYQRHTFSLMKYNCMRSVRVWIAIAAEVFVACIYKWSTHTIRNINLNLFNAERFVANVTLTRACCIYMAEQGVSQWKKSSHM